MRFPWANVALIFLFTFELLTGYLGLTHSNPEWIASMHLHRIAGFAILALFIWKSRNILSSFTVRRNWQRSPETMVLSTVLLLGLLTVLGLGLAWSHLGSYSWMGFSGTTIHMTLAICLLPLLLWHTFRHRISLRSRYAADRRNFLRLGLLGAAGLLVWQASESLLAVSKAPGAERRFTGSYPEDGPTFPVTMWLNDRTPTVNPDSWRLNISGHVFNPYELTLEALREWQDELTATLDCTGGWYTTRTWRGARLPDLLALANPKPGASSITITSRTGYFRRYSMDEAQRAMLATAVDDKPLTPGHGFPARMVEPHKRGYDWVKWVDSITVNDTGKLWQPPLPLT